MNINPEKGYENRKHFYIVLFLSMLDLTMGLFDNKEEELRNELKGVRKRLRETNKKLEECKEKKQFYR
ncbi:MAG: hypothetical protein V5A76_01715, partial [Candidatus Thermoplasmatota archaeon]